MYSPEAKEEKDDQDLVGDESDFFFQFHFPVFFSLELNLGEITHQPKSDSFCQVSPEVGRYLEGQDEHVSGW